MVIHRGGQGCILRPLHTPKSAHHLLEHEELLLTRASAEIEQHSFFLDFM